MKIPIRGIPLCFENGFSSGKNDLNASSIEFLTIKNDSTIDSCSQNNIIIPTNKTRILLLRQKTGDLIISEKSTTDGYIPNQTSSCCVTTPSIILKLGRPSVGLSKISVNRNTEECASNNEKVHLLENGTATIPLEALAIAYLKSAIPMFFQALDPYRLSSDITLPNSKSRLKGIQVIFDNEFNCTLPPLPIGFEQSLPMLLLNNATLNQKDLSNKETDPAQLLEKIFLYAANGNDVIFLQIKIFVTMISILFFGEQADNQREQLTDTENDTDSEDYGMSSHQRSTRSEIIKRFKEKIRHYYGRFK